MNISSRRTAGQACAALLGLTLATTHAAAEAVLYSFGATQNDGNTPVGGIITVQGKLYGTASSGGGPNQGGTVFQVTRAGTETTLYAFPSFYEGAPAAGLLYLQGMFYGTTAGFNPSFDKSNADGSVFSLTPQGTPTTLHEFSGPTGDGAKPTSTLVAVGNMLYGTTQIGGSCKLSKTGCGTVFTMPLNGGAEQVLYRFAGGADGAYPAAGLLNVRGTLYGTVSEGGPDNCGQVFKITTAGVKTVLHSFKSVGEDGCYPSAALIQVGDRLFGTTKYGGAYGTGTVFSIGLGGYTKVLHSFNRDGGDGSEPEAPLLYLNGLFYGTTALGGTVNTAAGGDGTIFRMTPTGTEEVLHSFGKTPTDGHYPSSGLTYLDGTLYGTTALGGAYGQGTVFKIEIDK